MRLRFLGQEDPLEEGMQLTFLTDYSCLGNPMDRGAWQAVVHRVAESDPTEHTPSRLRGGQCLPSAGGAESGRKRLSDEEFGGRIQGHWGWLCTINHR